MLHFSKKMVAVCLLCAPFATMAQDVQWEKSYGGKQAEYLFDAVPTADYGFLLAGSSLSGKTGNKSDGNRGSLDYWIWKMDEHGEAVWQKTFGGSGMDLLQSVKLTSDGGFVLAGTSHSPKGFDKKEDSRGLSDYWVLKLDAGGGEQWQRTIGGAAEEELVAVVQTKDGGYILGGTSSSDISGDKTEKSRGGSDYWIVRLDSQGNLKWQKTYGGQFADELRSLSATTDGGCIVGGYSNSPASGDKFDKNQGEGDFWILKLDAQGDIQWQKTYGGDKDDQLFSIFQSRDGGYVAGGHSNSGSSANKTASAKNGSDFWVVKLDADGNSSWQQNYDFGKGDILTSVVENPDGTLLIGGHAKSEGKGKKKDEEGINDYIALKTTEKGDVLWSRTLGSDGEDILRKLITTRDGGYLLAGTSNAARHNYSLNRQTEKQNQKLRPGNGKQLAGAKKMEDGVNQAIGEGREQANDFYREQAAGVADRTKNVFGEDSGVKTGLNLPSEIASQGGGSQSAGFDPSDALAGANHYKRQPASKDKAVNLGGSDFWVVKLRDKDKKEKAKQAIEAIPNPTDGYTNVVVGYDFENGTATVFDISGRMVQSFAISERTVPVNLGGLPEGIYIVQIRTNKSSDSVKVMKTN